MRIHNGFSVSLKGGERVQVVHQSFLSFFDGMLYIDQILTVGGEILQESRKITT